MDWPWMQGRVDVRLFKEGTLTFTTVNCVHLWVVTERNTRAGSLRMVPEVIHLVYDYGGKVDPGNCYSNATRKLLMKANIQL